MRSQGQRVVLTLLLAGMGSACVGVERSLAGSGDVCGRFLATLPDSDSVDVNLEALLVGDWKDLSAFNVPCETPVVFPDQVHRGWAQLPPKPVLAFRDAYGAAIVYAYLAAADGTDGAASGEPEGVALALVSYQPDGRVKAVEKVASQTRYEGYERLSSAVVTGNVLQVCRVELEYFLYSEDGSVATELDEPLKSESVCEKRSVKR